MIFHPGEAMDDAFGAFGLYLTKSFNKRNITLIFLTFSYVDKKI